MDMGTDEAKNAQAKIQDIMGSYDPEDDDADEKAEKSLAIRNSANT